MGVIHWRYLFLKQTDAGYNKTSFFISWLINYLATLLIFILALPLFVIVPILIKLEDGGPVLYRGLRMGKGKKTFYMYKFRTLVPKAEETIGSQLVSPRHHLETRLGYYLRETRIDELPQLLNVLKGDMDLVGPRPERPVVYEQMCKNIPGYDYRFKVKPGVIGHSQLFTPHNTPKKIRVFIDNHHIRLKQYFLYDFFFFLFTILVLIIKGFKITASFLLRIFKLLRCKHTWSELRTYERFKALNTQVIILPESDNIDGPHLITALEDINDESLTFNLDHQLNKDQPFRLKLIVKKKMGLLKKSTKKKVVYCTAKISHIQYSTLEEFPQFRHILTYTPSSELNFYRLHKYLLNKSIL